MRAFASWPSLHLICVHAWAPQVKVRIQVDTTKMMGVIDGRRNRNEDVKIETKCTKAFCPCQAMPDIYRALYNNRLRKTSHQSNQQRQPF